MVSKQARNRNRQTVRIVESRQVKRPVEIQQTRKRIEVKQSNPIQQRKQVEIVQVVTKKPKAPINPTTESKVLRLLQTGWNERTILNYLKCTKYAITRQVIRDIQKKHADKIVKYEWYF